jgi:peptidoglycan/xylan/chitin deacetylase (PgdA/CDA1 family)
MTGRMAALAELGYRMAGPSLQYRYSRAKFALGRRPSVASDRPAWRWPTPFRAAVVFSADFELGWAWRYARAGDPLALARDKARLEHANIPRLLRLFGEHNVPVTWATVGHLFLEQCDGAHADLPRPGHFSNAEWRFADGGWFDCDPGGEWRDMPEWCAPDLIRQIRAAGGGHEVGCHSFSHITFADAHCPPALAAAELRACQAAAAAWGIELRSLVFPGNFVGNLDAVAAAGFSAYRAADGPDLDWPRREASGLWRLPKGVCLEPPLPSWPIADWHDRLQQCLHRALETGTLCHYWFHPSLDPEVVRAALVPLLESLTARRGEVWVTTMGAMAEWLEREAGPEVER